MVTEDIVGCNNGSFHQCLVALPWNYLREHYVSILSVYVCGRLLGSCPDVFCTQFQWSHSHSILTLEFEKINRYAAAKTPSCLVFACILNFQFLTCNIFFPYLVAKILAIVYLAMLFTHFWQVMIKPFSSDGLAWMMKLSGVSPTFHALLINCHGVGCEKQRWTPLRLSEHFDNGCVMACKCIMHMFIISLVLLLIFPVQMFTCTHVHTHASMGTQNTC